MENLLERFEDMVMTSLVEVNVKLETMEKRLDCIEKKQRFLKQKVMKMKAMEKRLDSIEKGQGVKKNKDIGFDNQDMGFDNQGMDFYCDFNRKGVEEDKEDVEENKEEEEEEDQTYDAEMVDEKKMKPRQMKTRRLRRRSVRLRLRKRLVRLGLRNRSSYDGTPHPPVVDQTDETPPAHVLVQTDGTAGTHSPVVDQTYGTPPAGNPHSPVTPLRGRTKAMAKRTGGLGTPIGKRVRVPSQCLSSPFMEMNIDEIEGPKKKPKTKA
ncbi:unnamed protein product [Eruca vesicaria subsp. sativa]|uniref:Uncharacterized protein n=1 Tax=Eruca vesicaria subsp. sativa TaxID=29727 RepID=A0ABC8M9D4_ERUVS|nr:unnamed protein product [Eruca vesicaria subsp. sativa]